MSRFEQVHNVKSKSSTTKKCYFLDLRNQIASLPMHQTKGNIPTLKFKFFGENIEALLLLKMCII